jgi:archaellum biogenesis ATPase FlaH
MTVSTTTEISPRRISPDEARLLSDDGKRAYFANVRLGHRRINQTLETMRTLAQPNSGKSIILLYGPTGVGKSTLVSALGEMVIGSLREEMSQDPSFVPAIRIVAPASGERQFAWTMFYKSLGDALDEPLMGRKVETRLADSRVSVWQPGSKTSMTAMRMAVEKALVNRRTRMVVIDEAMPLIRAKGDRIDHHMDAIKTLADMGATLVLVGSYGLQRLATLDAQVARRAGAVHFRRYFTGVPEDEVEFRKVLGELQAHLPVTGVPDLMDRAGELQVACIGCVGILKTTLATALECALANGGRWSDLFLQRALPSDDTYETILRETLEGEAAAACATMGSGTFESLAAKMKAVQASMRASA